MNLKYMKFSLFEMLLFTMFIFLDVAVDWLAIVLKLKI